MLSQLLPALVRTTCAAALFVTVAPSLHAQENRAALDAFMKQMREHDAAIEELAAKNQGTAADGLTLIRTAAARTQTIKTEGLPADLQAAFREYAERTQAMADVFKDWPAKSEEVPAFIKRKTAENPNFLREQKKANEPAMTALTAAIDNLSAVAKKHGLEGLATLLQ